MHDSDRFAAVAPGLAPGFAPGFAKYHPEPGVVDEIVSALTP